MRLIDKLLGSDQQLARPDFERARQVMLSYSGVGLQLRDAPHSAISPLVDTVETLDLYIPELFERQKDGSYAQLFYSRGWELQGWRWRAVGGCEVTGRFLYFPDFPKRGQSCFWRRDFELELLKFCHDVWGWMNPGAVLGSLGEARIVYPVSPQDFTYKDIGATSWCHFTSRRKGRPPEMLFATAVTREHILIFEFTLSAYDGIDFYSPETNLKETCFQIVEDFMNHVRVELPDAVRAQQREDVARDLRLEQADADARAHR